MQVSFMKCERNDMVTIIITNGFRQKKYCKIDKRTWFYSQVLHNRFVIQSTDTVKKYLNITLIIYNTHILLYR